MSSVTDTFVDGFKYPSSKGADALNTCRGCSYSLGADFNFAESTQTKQAFKGLLHASSSCDMAAVCFLHHENPPTWAGVEPETLGVHGQRRINYATFKKRQTRA
ncbi:hypothetical protein TNCV_899781 [Trichonephila clavipes]|nr:hypothetical protein TNCV_899781 [Trichonephila clavipes]